MLLLLFRLSSWPSSKDSYLLNKASIFSSDVNDLSLPVRKPRDVHQQKRLTSVEEHLQPFSKTRTPTCQSTVGKSTSRAATGMASSHRGWRKSIIFVLNMFEKKQREAIAIVRPCASRSREQPAHAYRREKTVQTHQHFNALRQAFYTRAKPYYRRSPLKRRTETLFETISCR